jgi:enamine deaminase RidA (YjgF/YER057c/UK114 family)
LKPKGDEDVIDLLNIEQRLKELGLSLPPPPKPAGSYEPAILNGNLLYVSGVTPKQNGALTVKGKVGRDLSTEEGYKGAQICAAIILSIIKSAIGDLNRIEQIIKLTGFISCDDTFTQHPKVIDGASNVFLDVLGERGKHARCAIGVASLPGGAGVELDAIVKIRP